MAQRGRPAGRQRFSLQKGGQKKQTMREFRDFIMLKAGGDGEALVEAWLDRQDPRLLEDELSLQWSASYDNRSVFSACWKGLRNWQITRPTTRSGSSTQSLDTRKYQENYWVLTALMSAKEVRAARVFFWSLHIVMEGKWEIH